MDSSLRDLNDQFSSIEDDWPEMLSQHCNPLEISLKLLDNSSIGEAHKYPRFQQLKQQFSGSLKNAVNKHYMEFNDGIGSFSIAVASLAESQNTLSKIINELSHINEFAGHRATFLVELSNKQKQYSDTIDALEKIAEIRDNSSKIDEAISDKNFDLALKLIQKSTQLASDYGLFTIPALSGTQQNLHSQSQRLFDSLIDQVSNLVYMKGIDSGNSSHETATLFSLATTDVNDIVHAVVRPMNEFFKELKNGISEGNMDGVSPGDDTHTYHSLYHLFKLLSGLNKIPDALKLLSERSATEIRRLIRATAEEIRNKYPIMSQAQQLGESVGNPSAMDEVTGLELPVSQGINTSIISDFFKELSQKLTYVLQYHRAVSEIATHFKVSFQLSDIWHQLARQVSSIIYSYIIDDKLLERIERHRNYRDTDISGPFVKPPLDYTPGTGDGPIVQLARLNLSSDSTQATARELRSILKQMFPEQFAGDTSELDGNNSLFIEDDSDGMSHTRNSVLVQPNIFNMGSIVDSFLFFVGAAKLILPGELGKQPMVFFNHFINYIFRVHLENTLLYQLDRVWEQNPANIISLRRFFDQVMNVLDTSLYFREPYASIIMKLFERLGELYQLQMNEVVPPSFLQKVKTRLISSWFHNDKLLKVSSELLDSSQTGEQRSTLMTEELQLCLAEGDEKTLSLIKVHDFLDSSRFNSLAQVLESLLDLLVWLPKYKRDVKSLAIDPTELSSLKEAWHIADSDLIARSRYASEDTPEAMNHPFVSIGGKLIERFSLILQSLKTMATKIKLYMRYDFKIKAIWCISRMYSTGNWVPEYQSEEIDPNLIWFNRNVIQSNRRLQQKIRDSDRMQIFLALPYLLDYLMVHKSRAVVRINGNATHRICINLKVLQQMLRNVLDPKEVDFSRSVSYFTLFNTVPEKIADAVLSLKQKYPLSLSDCKNLVRMVYSVPLATSSSTKPYGQAIRKVEQGFK